LKNGERWKIKIYQLKTDKMWPSKNKIKSAASTPPASDKIANQIAGTLIKIQNGFSTGMNKLFRKLGMRKLKLVLISFCFMTGGYSMILIVRGAQKNDKQTDTFIISHLPTSKYFKRPNDIIIPLGKYINEETFRKIQLFKNYLDSLKQQDILLYDSILNSRPLLVDSVLKLEEMYLSQTQK
jgi:hypothetical protein